MRSRAEGPSRLTLLAENCQRERWIKERYPAAKDEDYLFLPSYKNRQTAARIIQRQFNIALEQAGIKHDPFTDTQHSVYSLRHTAICMRIILSHGQVNIFNLAKSLNQN